MIDHDEEETMLSQEMVDEDYVGEAFVDTLLIDKILNAQADRFESRIDEVCARFHDEFGLGSYQGVKTSERTYEVKPED